MPSDTASPCSRRSEKPQAGFQRVTERVPEIEQCALAGLALVARDDVGFGAAANRNRVLAGRTAGENVLPVLFEPGEKRGIAEQPVFGDLGITGAEIALAAACRATPYRQ